MQPIVLESQTHFAPLSRPSGEGLGERAVQRYNDNNHQLIVQLLEPHNLEPHCLEPHRRNIPARKTRYANPVTVRYTNPL